jgi:hypothetical protein
LLADLKKAEATVKVKAQGLCRRGGQTKSPLSYSVRATPSRKWSIHIPKWSPQKKQAPL